MTRYIEADVLQKRWVCQVVRSGFHNGAGCIPNDPHHDIEWGCGFRYELSVTPAEFERLTGPKVPKVETMDLTCNGKPESDVHCGVVAIHQPHTVRVTLT